MYKHHAASLYMCVQSKSKYMYKQHATSFTCAFNQNQNTCINKHLFGGPSSNATKAYCKILCSIGCQGYLLNRSSWKWNSCQNLETYNPWELIILAKRTTKFWGFKLQDTISTFGNRNSVELGTHGSNRGKLVPIFGDRPTSDVSPNWQSASARFQSFGANVLDPVTPKTGTL